MRLSQSAGGFTLEHGGRPLLEHHTDRPLFSIGIGEADIVAYRGNFDIRDRIIRREALARLTLTETTDEWQLAAYARGSEQPALVMQMMLSDSKVVLRAVRPAAWINRFWLRLPATPEEAIWGGGEQMSYFDLRGRRYRLWTSEPGVGRDKSTAITQQADATGHAGGDFDHTNYPQPTFISSRGHAVHIGTTAHAAFDPTNPNAHEIECWSVPETVEIFCAPDPASLVTSLSTRFGRQPKLPPWVDRGVILGLKRGEDHARARLEEALAANIRVAALWCEDWAGVRQTSFGTRLFWDWHWRPDRYPHLDQLIADLHVADLRFLGYVSPYLCDDGALFPQAEKAGAFARNRNGATARVDFGEFSCGIIDLTSSSAASWFRQHVLDRMLELGMDGWMADFGEYLPTDVRLASGADPLLEHNAWPVRWAALNEQALAQAGRRGDAVFFMRAGYSGSQRHCPLLWAGDQCVDFSRHDGLETAICAALSSGLMGHAYHHSDIGGYTSLFGLRRTPELFSRWAEFAAFTPVMRTHEGNRPEENFQWWEDRDTIAHLARMTDIFATIAPYRRALMQEASATGLPLLRPPILHFPADRAVWRLHDHVMLGPDLLLAPVHKPGIQQWTVRLPAGADWRHLWTNTEFSGGQAVMVDAPLGWPPVFLRAGSTWAALFVRLRDLAFR